MKIDDFMDLYKLKKNNEEKEKLVKSHIKTDYVPYEKKADVSKAIVDACYWKNVKTTNEDNQKILHVDSVAKYMLTCMAVVDLFTDIERHSGDGKMLDDFNVLNQAGVLDYIIQNVDERQMKEFNMILQMTCNDVITNEYENHAFISKQVDRFADIFSTVLAPIISQIDVEKIKDVIEQM